MNFLIMNLLRTLKILNSEIFPENISVELIKSEPKGEAAQPVFIQKKIYIIF